MARTPHSGAARAARGNTVARRLWRDASGVSAVEFAIFAPILIMLLLGLGDVVPSMIARYDNSHATESVADLVAQYPQMKPSDMVSAYSAATDVQGNLAGSAMDLRITNVYSDGLGHAYVNWSCGEGALPPYAAKTPVTTTPTGSPLSSLLLTGTSTANGFTLNGANTSYVMTESRAVFTAPFEFVMKGPQTMTATAYLLPRQSSYVGFPWDGNSDDDPAPPVGTSQVQTTTLSNGVTCSYAT